MKKIAIIYLMTVLSVSVFAQGTLLTPKGVTFPAYTTGTRPLANSVGLGTVLYNTSDNTHQFSNGSAWLNLLGTTSVPSGTANQTLRNNGSGWVADNLMKNSGTMVQIGADDATNTGLLSVNSASSTALFVKTTSNSVALTVNSFDSHGIYSYSLNQYGVYGFSPNSYGVYGESNNSIGVKGTSYSYPGVAGYSSYNNGIYGNSYFGNGIYGYSNISYGGQFHGRLRLQRGGNGDAGIEFERSNFTQGGYVGMNGDNEMMLFGYGYNAAIQRWNVNTGTICYATTPTICSDIRLKKDFINLTNSLASIAQLKGYNYYLRNEKNPNLHTGFIAQEIQKIFPELVQKGSDGYLSVDYVGLIPHLVESVKTLKSENEALKERLLKIEVILNASTKQNE